MNTDYIITMNDGSIRKVKELKFQGNFVLVTSPTFYNVENASNESYIFPISINDIEKIKIEKRGVYD